jgi:hypothetical protein
MNEVYDCLRERYFPEPIILDSGNGYHLLFLVDLPADDSGLIERALKALAFKFSDDKVKIDSSNCNAARIWKMPGTLARKGDDTPDRPHRRAQVLEIPGGLGAVPATLLEALAAEAPGKTNNASSHENSNGFQSSKLNVPRWLNENRVAFRQKKDLDAKGRTIFVLKECPFDPAHGDPDSCIMQAADGTLAAKCLHNTCTRRGWQQFKEKVGKPRPEHYDPPLGAGPTVTDRGGNDTKSSPAFLEPLPISQLVRPGPQSWLWHGFLKESGITLLSSLWKTGKTTLLSRLLLALQRGGSFLGLPIRVGKVCYVTEEHAGLWADGRDELGITDSTYVLSQPFAYKATRAEWESWLRFLAGWLAKHPCEALIFDTLSHVWPVRNENDAGEVQETLMPLRPLAADRALAVVHHLKKFNDGAGDGTGTRGSGALMGFADVVAEMRRFRKPGDDEDDDDDRRRILSAVSRFEETPRKLVIRLDESGDFVAEGDGREVKRAKLVAEVIESLPAEPPGISNSALHAKLPKDVRPRESALLGVLHEGFAKKWWIRTGGGKPPYDPYRFWKAK